MRKVQCADWLSDTVSLLETQVGYIYHFGTLARYGFSLLGAAVGSAQAAACWCPGTLATFRPAHVCAAKGPLFLCRWSSLKPTLKRWRPAPPSPANPSPTGGLDSFTPACRAAGPGVVELGGSCPQGFQQRPHAHISAQTPALIKPALL